MSSGNVKVFGIEHELRSDNWTLSGKIAKEVHQLASEWYGGSVGGYLLRGVPVIDDVKRVISHGLDRYSPDIAPRDDPPSLRGKVDRTRTGWVVPLDSKSTYPIRLVLWNFVLPKYGNTCPAGLLFLRESKSVLLEGRGYGHFYGFTPGALDTILLLHLR